MLRNGVRLIVVLALSLAAGAAWAGGTARVTILDSPKQIVAGQKFEVAFTVQPNWPMSKERSLEPLVTAAQGDRVVTVTAVALEKKQHYKAAITLPDAGEWTIRVDSRFCHTEMTPLVLTAAANQ